MRRLEISAFELAQQFIGIKEVAGVVDNHQIMAMLKLDMSWPGHDEVPWCSAFINYVAKLLGLPRSKDLRARSWLNVGIVIPGIELAEIGSDIVIFKRGPVPQPGPTMINAPGHVGFYAGIKNDKFVLVLGGNQDNTVKISSYPLHSLLGVRRLY